MLRQTRGVDIDVWQIVDASDCELETQTHSIQ